MENLNTHGPVGTLERYRASLPDYELACVHVRDREKREPPPARTVGVTFEGNFEGILRRLIVRDAVEKERGQRDRGDAGDGDNPPFP